jgi:hypothetical protein
MKYGQSDHFIYPKVAYFEIPNIVTNIDKRAINISNGRIPVIRTRSLYCVYSNTISQHRRNKLLLNVHTIKTDKTTIFYFTCSANVVARTVPVDITMGLLQLVAFFFVKVLRSALVTHFVLVQSTY